MAIAREAKTASSLARELGVTKQAIAYLLEVLIDRGYVKRELNPSDRREQRIGLTAKGRSLTAHAARILHQIELRWGSEVGIGVLDELQGAASLIATAEPGAARPIW
jgi:DNA-binding MarR family transcriptional regulator